MNEELAKRIYEILVEDGSETYRELYETIQLSEQTIEYWKKAIYLYSTFDRTQKDIFINILKQTIIDTISGVFGMLDGSSTGLDDNFVINININGKNVEGELQDAFLEVVEKMD